MIKNVISTGGHSSPVTFSNPLSFLSTFIGVANDAYFNATNFKF
jgi:hypothetical protein